MNCPECKHRHCDKKGTLGCAFCPCGHPAGCDCGGCVLTRFFDPEESVEIDEGLTSFLTPAELAEVDQLLASRHDLGRALMGAGKTGMAMLRAKWTVSRITDLLRAAVQRREGKTGST